MAATSDEHISPTARLLDLLAEERKDLAALALYVTLNGVLILAVPLSAQALVNTIAAGVFLQPLVVLTTLVFLCLLLAGLVEMFKLLLIERLQQRVFARIALQLASYLPHVEHTTLHQTYAPQMVNRFFDVLTIQKTLSKLLLDGPTAVLQIIIGLVLMAIYSPFFLSFGLFILCFLAFIIWGLGYNGLRTSIKESYAKYHVAEWLEEIARCQVSFKTFALTPFAVHRTDNLVLDYVTRRRAHFRVLFRQAFAHYLFRALASAGVLALGGWLIINRQLSLGQLVAANLVVLSLLAAADKLLRLLENAYDLLTAVDKVGHLLDLPLERSGGRPLQPAAAPGTSVSCQNVRFAYADGSEALEGFNLEIGPGSIISLVGRSGAGKSTLAALLCGLVEPSHGSLLVDGQDIRSIDLAQLRATVALVGNSNDAFEGTIEENIVAGRAISSEQLQWALDAVRLSRDLANLPRGLATPLVGAASNLSRGQIQRLLIARAIVGRPRLLILDEAFVGIDEQDKLLILDILLDSRQGWTIINISHDLEVVLRSSLIYVLENGRVMEKVHTDRLASEENPFFYTLFPTIAATRSRRPYVPAASA